MAKGERFIYGSIVLVIAAGVILQFAAPDWMESVYLAEDGLLEWLIVVIFAFMAALCFRRAVQLRRIRPVSFVIVAVLLGLGFTFGVGEELSWGQRIFGIETPELLMEHNKQQELNLHNLVVGETSINKFVFGRLLALGLLLYFFLLPWLENRNARVAQLVERFGLPVPTRTQSIALIPALALPDLLVDSGETDELREVCGAFLIAALYCYPRNAYIFSADWRSGDPVPENRGSGRTGAHDGREATGAGETSGAGAENGP